MRYVERMRQRLRWLPASNEEGAVHINGVRLAPGQVMAFAKLTAQPTPRPGHYWFDPTTGNVGYVGSPVPCFNAYLGASPLAARGGQAPTLSERRQLFVQADLNDIWISSD